MDTVNVQDYNLLGCDAVQFSREVQTRETSAFIFFYPEDGESMFLRNVVTDLPSYMTSYP
jgi:hypothetical protein